MTSKTKVELRAQSNKHIIITLTFGLAVTYIAWVYAPFEGPADPSLTNRLVFTLRWLMLSMIPIITGIHLVAMVRYENMDTAGADPTAPYSEELVRLRQRALQNTMEQTALHVPIMLTFSTYLDPSCLKLVPIIICMFVFGRITFYIGYLTTGNHLNRVFGFALTFFSNMIPFAYCMYRLLVGGVNYG